MISNLEIAKRWIDTGDIECLSVVMSNGYINRDITAYAIENTKLPNQYIIIGNRHFDTYSYIRHLDQIYENTRYWHVEAKTGCR